MTSKQSLFIRLLKNNKNWAAIPARGGSIQLSYLAKGKTITVYFIPSSDGKYSIKPAAYKYRSVCSHFDYNEQETRYSRNKTILAKLLRVIQESQLAPYITNLESFLMVNVNNPKTDKSKMSAALKKMIQNS